MSSYLADAHRQWHQIHGKYSTCDLDCLAGEVVGETFEADAEALQEPNALQIRCGSCKGRHASVATVKFCYEVEREAKKYAEAYVDHLVDEGECEHGLSQALCSGPGHYPADRHED